MPSTKSILMAAAIAFSGTVSGHMVMATPKPFGKPNSNPLDKAGSDFPCKVSNGVYDTQGIINNMPQGSSQKLSFTGSAVHGGGSCQVSLSADLKPTKKSQWKVIHSIIGGCPARNTVGNLPENAQGADPDTYQFTIPKDLAVGDYTLAWTWFNRIGNREMYMNCAPITVTGGSGASGNGTVKRAEDSLIDDTFLTKRSAGSLSSLSSAPDMFVANAGDPGCQTADNKDLRFPNPGSSVEILVPVVDGGPSSPDKTNPVGPIGCGGSTGSNSGSPSGGSSSLASGSSATSAAAPPSNTGGVFAPSASSVAASSTSAAPSVASTVPSSPPVVAPSSRPSAPGNGSGSGSVSGGAQSGACTTEGTFNCIGGTSFQQCASGTWSVVQQMASGTKCTPGQTQTLSILAGKRNVRFSRGHSHRHHNSYLDTY